MTELMKKYTTKARRFKMGPDSRYIRVYNRGRLDGFIWNCDRIVTVDGESVVSSEFFK